MRRMRPENPAVVAQAAVVELPFEVDVPGEPAQPAAIALVAVLPDGPYVPSSSVVARDAGPELVIEALNYLEERDGIVPEVIRVTNVVLAGDLRRLLGSSTTIEVVDELPELDAAVAGLAEMAEHQRLELPSPLVVPDVTEADLRAFAEAAARFWEAAPWRSIDSDHDIIVIEAPRLDPTLRAVSVMGGAGIEFGLALLADPDDFPVMADAGYLEEHALWSVSLLDEDHAPVDELRVWEELGLPRVGGSIPVAYCLGPGARIRRASRRLLAFFSALMDALAATTEEELDSGRWSRSVETRVGRQTVALKLPSVLGMNRPQPAEKAMNPLRMEQLTRGIGRLLAEGSFASLDEANAFLEREVTGKPFVAPPPRTKTEEAQELAYRAIEEGGRVRSILARRALALDPDCSDSYLALGYGAFSAAEARSYFEQAVAAGERALGPEVFAEQVGSFWSDPDTRPYMRARLELAGVLWTLDRRDEAIAHYRELLRLNPNDNQGVRDILVPALLAHGDLAGAEEILKRYKEKGTTFSDFNLALLRFAQDGDSTRARRALSEALTTNHLVAALLLDDEPHEIPPSYRPRSFEEAEAYASLATEAWDTVPGALDWLVDRLASTTPRRRPRRKLPPDAPIPF